MRIIVCMKQVVDPLISVPALAVDHERKKVLGPQYTPPVINGYDEQALEAALRLKDDWQDGPCEVIGLSAGERFNLDVMRGALAAGADDLALVEDPALDTPDSGYLARVLAASISRKLGGADLVLCGRQASDWDHAQVPLLLAELLGWPCLTLARRVEVQGRRVRVERVLGDGGQTMEAELPAVVTVTSELGELRYPSVRARLQVARRRPQTLPLKELGVQRGLPALEVLDLSLIQMQRDCHYVQAAGGAAAGRQLARILLEAGLLEPQRPQGGQA
ncbi:MAG: electron transfer flavoprotein subunit beta [Chloroflexi bacterium]|nr:electron transfer flavoprotein subunit beta [Chloroflexota bacterium]